MNKANPITGFPRCKIDGTDSHFIRTEQHRTSIYEAQPRTTMSTFTITFCIQESGALCGAVDVRMKVPLTEEMYQTVRRMVETRFHFILTHAQQEGVLEESTFCSTSFRDLLLAVEEIGELFGEDATVELDRNMAYYREAGMDSLFRKVVVLNVGAPQRREHADGSWDFVSMEEGWERLFA